MEKFCLKKYRALILLIPFCICSLGLAAQQVGMPVNLDVINPPTEAMKYTDATNSLYHFLAEEAILHTQKRAVEVKSINDKEGVLKRQALMKKIMLRDFFGGKLPDRTPLNVKTINKIQKDGYHVENLIYESLPGFYVTASLFLPDGIKKPAPAILFGTGHSMPAFRRDLYQIPILNLVKKGFVVLAYDPIGQGERLQYLPEDASSAPYIDSALFISSTRQHSYASAQMLLTGRSIAWHFIWDGMRGIDYLVSRKEVDPNRIGAHGLSGGGTQTAYLSVFDDRIKASAPAGYITSYQRLMETRGVQDGEQNFYHGISDGIDFGDFIEIFAPKPFLIMATTRDFFSIQGVRETYAEAKRIYDILGVPDNLQKTEDDFGHGYTKKNREAMYAFFQKYLDLPGSSTEEEPKLLTAEELDKTSTGQLQTSKFNGETVFSLNRKNSLKLFESLAENRSNFSIHKNDLIEAAKELSGYKEPASKANPIFTGRYQQDGFVIEKYYLNGEGNYIIPYLLMIPDKPNRKAVIYLHPSGKKVEAKPGGEIEKLVREGFTVLAPDLIGIGEMGKGVFKGDAHMNDISFNLLFTSTMIGRSILGIRAGDIVRLANLLQARDNIQHIYSLAKGELGPVLLHAASFDTKIERIALIDSYNSYRSVVMSRFYRPQFINSFVPGSLTRYDLPDLAACIAPRQLLMFNTVDAEGKIVEERDLWNEYGFVRDCYRKEGVTDQLKLTDKKSVPNLDSFSMLLENWNH